MADTINTLNFTYVRRPAPKSGPSSSDAWNDSHTELANDLATISFEWNNKLVPVLEGLPDGTLDTSVNVYRNGLDGRTMWVNGEAVSSDDDLTYFDQVRNRPTTVHESFQAVYTHIASQVNQVRDDIVDQATGLTTDQKNRIGANVFDNTQTSTTGSLDGKSERNRLNVIQLAADLYGPSYALGNDGATDLNNSVFAMVDALLELHNGNWSDDINLNHSGAFTATQADVNTSSPGNDGYAGTPSDLEEDLNQIRTQLKNIKGTGSWLSVLPQLYAGGADDLQDLLGSTSGSAAKSASNPWGYSFADVDGLESRLDAIRDFAGQTTHADASPSYSSTAYINNGDSLETAIGDLDSALGSIAPTFSSLITDLGTEIAATRTFVGQDSTLDSSPSYSSTTFISNGDPLETAIGKLDNVIDTTSGIFSSAVGQVNALETFVGQSGPTDETPNYTSTVFVDTNDNLTTAIGKLDAARRVTVDSIVHSGIFTASYDTLHRVSPIVASGLSIVIPTPLDVPGSMITIKNQSNSNQQINLTSSGLYTIDGDTVKSFTGARTSIDLVADGADDWMIV